MTIIYTAKNKKTLKQQSTPPDKKLYLQQELIRRCNSEREPLYDDIAHVL